MVDRAGGPARVIEVLVVDDHRSFADALVIALELEPDLSCLPPVTSAEAAIDAVGDRCPDVVLLDVVLPGGMDGVTAIPQIRSRCPAARIIMVTADVSGEVFVDAVEAGADGFLPKEAALDRVVEAVRADRHDLVSDPVWMQRALEHAVDAGEVRPAPELTEREYEILVLLAEGLAVKQVARRLGMSVHTCRGHVAAVLRKLDAHSQLGAVVAAARMGLLPNLRGPSTEL